MDKPGQVDIVAGWVWIIMGVLSMVFTVAVIRTISLWSFVPIAVGVGQLGRGLNRAAASRRRDDTPEAAKRREHDTGLAAMVFVAADAGAVTRERAAQIDNVSQEMFGGRPDSERVRTLAEKAFDLELLLERNAPLLAPEARMRVVQAARAVAALDAGMGERMAIVSRRMDAV